MTEGLALELGAQTLHLLAQRALWWPAAQTLVLADLHLNKDHALRRRGLALPAGAQADDLQRLDALLAQTGAQRLLVLGDLLHEAPQADDSGLAALRDWRQRHAALQFCLVPGNHDRQLLQIAALFEAQCWADGTRLHEVALHHAPPPDCDQPSLSGHLHPVLQLSGSARQRLRRPLFWLRGQRLVLPAFGQLTGGATVLRQPADRCFVLDAGSIFEWPPPA